MNDKESAHDEHNTRQSVESVRVQYATLEMLNMVDKKVDAVITDIGTVRGWLEGDVSPLGVQKPGVLMKVEQSARDLHAAKNWLRGVFVAITVAVLTQWVFYFLPKH